MRYIRFRPVVPLVLVALSACGTTPRDEFSATLKGTDAPYAAADTVSVPIPTSAESLPEPDPTTTVAIDVTGPRSDAAANVADPVEVGELLDVADLWDLRVAAVDTDAAAVVLAFDPANPAPPPGSRYVMVWLQGRSLSTEIVQPAFDWWLSDGSGEFRPSIPGCGLLPDSIYDVADLEPDEVFDAQLCTAVPIASASLQLHIRPLGGRTWVFDL
jgi:hypothetical protein